MERSNAVNRQFVKCGSPLNFFWKILTPLWNIKRASLKIKMLNYAVMCVYVRVLTWDARELKDQLDWEEIAAFARESIRAVSDYNSIFCVCERETVYNLGMIYVYVVEYKSFHTCVCIGEGERRTRTSYKHMLWASSSVSQPATLFFPTQWIIIWSF